MKRRYSDEERANALAALKANGGNVQRTANEIGVPAKTLENWSKQFRHPEAAMMGEQKIAPLADKLEAIAHQLADAIPGKIGDASLQQTTVSLGISVDKMRLLRGEPTDIVKAEFDLGQLTDDQLGQLESLLTAASGRRAAGALPPQP